MRSAFGGLNTVVRGLNAQQVSLDTVGHNISNANTEGYSRQSVNLTTIRPQAVYGANGENQLGTGVNIESITRARDAFIDRQMWKESSSLGYGQTASDTLGRIEGVFHEPSDTGVQTTLDKFWSSWQTLAVNASDEGTRAAVRQRGVEVVDTIQHANQQLKDMITDTNAVIDIKVNNVNQISSEIYALNRQVVTIEAGGIDHANDLRDKRDALVDKMSKLANINVSQDKLGNYNIQTAGVSLVDGDGFRKLVIHKERDPDYGYEIHHVMLEGDTQPIKFTNGELRGLFEMRDSVVSTNSYDGIKGYIKKLDKISEFLLKDFNNVHKAGLGTDNSTGHNFFGKESTDYNKFSPPANTVGWIDQLKVSSALLNPTNGLARIAAKTSINNLAVQQSNGAGGIATVDSTYTGAKPLNYRVRIDSMASEAMGDVASLSVSLNNGATWETVSAKAPATVPNSFQITTDSGVVNVQVATDNHNKVGDIYTFAVSQGNASGDNAVNLANSMKLDVSSTLGQATLDSFYNSVIGGLGVQSQSATSLTTNQKTLVGQINNWRESVSGVNVDEEMSNMIRFQKGYAASARVLTTMDEMLDKLINNTGVVGR